MSYVHLNSRTRSNANTRRRDQNVMTLIGALRNGPMLRADLQSVLDMSESGTNRYIAMLRADGVIEIERFLNPTPKSPGHAMFRLARDAGHVEDYLRAVAAGSALRDRKKQEGRTVHILQGDGPFRHAAPSYAIPAPDPVLAHFYGLVRPQATA